MQLIRGGAGKFDLSKELEWIKEAAKEHKRLSENVSKETQEYSYQVDMNNGLMLAFARIKAAQRTAEENGFNQDE